MSRIVRSMLHTTCSTLLTVKRRGEVKCQCTLCGSAWDGLEMLEMDHSMSCKHEQHVETGVDWKNVNYEPNVSIVLPFYMLYHPPLKHRKNFCPVSHFIARYLWLPGAVGSQLSEMYSCSVAHKRSRNLNRHLSKMVNLSKIVEILCSNQWLIICFLQYLMFQNLKWLSHSVSDRITYWEVLSSDSVWTAKKIIAPLPLTVVPHHQIFSLGQNWVAGVALLQPRVRQSIDATHPSSVISPPAAAPRSEASLLCRRWSQNFVGIQIYAVWLLPLGSTHVSLAHCTLYRNMVGCLFMV